MLEKTLLKITRILDKNRIPYMLIGGYAMVIHGFPRLTQDLDISLGIDTERIADVLKAVEDDFKTLVNDPMAFARDTNVLLLQDTETGIRIDLIFTFIEFERKAIDEAVEMILAEKIDSVDARNISDIIREMSSILQNDSYESWNSILLKFK